MNYTYPKSYIVKSVDSQMSLLNKLFGIKKLSGYEIPENMSEGVFAIPHWKLIGTTYNDAVIKVLEEIKAFRPSYDWRNGHWSADYLRQLPVKEQFWSSQKEEIILIFAQFGQSHAGESVEIVRSKAKSTELPFGIYEVGIMLLMHPERLQDKNDLWMDCPGDQYSYSGDGVFECAPYFGFCDGMVKFDAGDVSDVYGDCGSASGLVLQSLVSGNLGVSDVLDLDHAISRVKEAGYVVYKPV